MNEAFQVFAAQVVTAGRVPGGVPGRNESRALIGQSDRRGAARLTIHLNWIVPQLRGRPFRDAACRQSQTRTPAE
jgi:hypothetical protein